MVTRKRKIETEQDRFGGFEYERPVDKSVFRNDTISIPDGYQTHDRNTDYHAPAYSRRDAEKVYARPDFAKDKRTGRLSEEDIMPSIKTMSYIEQNKAKIKSESRDRMEGKTKVMLAVYMIVVVMLAAIVIGTGIVINSVSANIDSLAVDIQNSNAKIEVQSKEIDSLDSEFGIMNKATDPDGALQMTPVDYDTEIELIPFIEEEPPVQNGAFAGFCDWMKRVLGG